MRHNKTQSRRNLMLMMAVLATFWIGHPSIETFARSSARSVPELSTPERVEAEQRLWDLGYWAGIVDGKFDSDSRHALTAFQKVERRARTGKLTLEELNALRAATRPQPRHTRYPHAEIDLERQVLFVID